MEGFTIFEEVDGPENALSDVPDVRAASHDRPNVLAVLGGCLSSVAAWNARCRTHAVLLGFMSAPAACFKVCLPDRFEHLNEHRRGGKENGM